MKRSIKSKNKQLLFWTAGGILAAIALVALGYFFGHREENYDPYAELNGFKYSRHQYLVRSSEVSVKMANRAIEALKKKNVNEAIEDCKVAIDIFPIDAKPYILLTKLYLMTGQEEKMYQTLTLAGRSYPNFDNIVSIIDDDDLYKIPLGESQDSVSLAAFPGNKKMAMSFMFDDGEANVYKALPTFEKYGYRCTIPVVAGFVADKSNDPFWGSWEEWRDAANRGFEIANHSMFHRDSLQLHGSDFDLSIDQAKEAIEKNIGHKVTAYVFPHDSYSDESVGRALKMHESVRTHEFLSQYYNRTVDVVIGGHYVSVQTAERLVDIAIKRRLWLIGKCHGVTDKASMRSFKSITPEFLETYLSYIHSRSADIWVDTFSNIFEYMLLRSQTKIETKNATANSIDLVLHNNKPGAKISIPLTVVVQVPDPADGASALTADGHKLKAWSCDVGKLCVDVDTYDEDFHVAY